MTSPGFDLDTMIDLARIVSKHPQDRIAGVKDSDAKIAFARTVEYMADHYVLAKKMVPLVGPES